MANLDLIPQGQVVVASTCYVSFLIPATTKTAKYMQKKIKNSFISNSDVQRANIGNAAFCIQKRVF